ncbi:conserved membrane hypothetical protein [uncultured Thiomicrorhabdus sp.]
MKEIIQKTFGGLTTQYYFRNLFFGLFITAFVVYMEMNATRPTEWAFYPFVVLSTFLYPYSRFVYESIIDFVMGENTLFVNVFLVILVKFFTIMICWFFAIFIAPVGLAYLYYYHSKSTR